MRGKLLRLVLALIAASLLLVGVLMVIGLIEAGAEPVRRETVITASGFPQSEKPFRVALLSDIHFGNRAMKRDRLEAIVAAVNAAQPDLVVIAGDFVNGHNGRIETDPNDLIAPLAALKAPGGVIATMGNHEHWTDLAAVQAALGKAGVVVLANQALRRGPLLILGLDDDYTRHADGAAALASGRGLGGVPVAVTHSPDLVPTLPSSINLVLAGHTHCGQVVLPRIGSLAPIFGKLVGDKHYFNPRYQCGIIHDGQRTTIVTAGLGSGSIPFRVGAPADWWLVTFRAR